ncbi:hypothetical protein [Streptomyces cyaneofuscatus]
MFESGEGRWDATGRVLKDRVSRALSGKGLSLETLHWFVMAFDMKDEDRRYLHAAHSGKPFGPAGVSHTLQHPVKLAMPQRHRTVALVERYEINSVGALTSRFTTQMIRAAEDGVSAYFFGHEAEVSDVEILRGGRLGKRYEYGGGLRGVEILLGAPLAESEVTTLEYRTTFVPRPTRTREVRRTAFARAENVSLSVRFADRRGPRQAWQCVWDAPLGVRPVREEALGPEDASLYRFFPFIEETVVGFRWT